MLKSAATTAAVATTGTKLHPFRHVVERYVVSSAPSIETAVSGALLHAKSDNIPAIPIVTTTATTTLLGALRGGGGASLVDAHSSYGLSLVLAAFFCSAVFGMMLFVALALMPGLATLEDGALLRAFRGIDGIFQEGRPAILVFWFGAVLSLLQTTVMGFRVDGTTAHERRLLLAATALHLAGQVVTVAFFFPRNDRVQRLHDISRLSKATQAAERLYFERPWVRVNWIRTVLFGGTSLCLLWTLLLQ